MITARKTYEDSGAQQREGSSWMLIFADLLSLLLTFFVLLYSMSSIQYESWKSVVETMTYQFNPNRPKIAVEPNTPPHKLTEHKTAGLNLTYLQARFETAIEAQASLEGSTVSLTPSGVTISIPAALLFNRKGVLLETGVVKALSSIAGTLRQIENQVRVAGHTDEIPVSSGQFRSNWELSMTRARIVAGILTDAGYLEPITILGYADTAADGNSQAALGMAERIEIIIVAERKEKNPYALF